MKNIGIYLLFFVIGCVVYQCVHNSFKEYQSGTSLLPHIHMNRISLIRPGAGYSFGH